MTEWRERAADLLFEGETAEASVPIGDGGVVVTTHRVLAFTPGTGGTNYRHVDRPNAEDVRVETVGETGWLEYVARGAVLGAVAVGIGATLDFGGLVAPSVVDPGAAGRIGLGSLLSVLGAVSWLLALLDDALLVGGLLALALALGTLGAYLESRERLLVVGVAGGEDLRVPAPGDADADGATARLRAALDAPDGPQPKRK